MLDHLFRGNVTDFKSLQVQKKKNMKSWCCAPPVRLSSVCTCSLLFMWIKTQGNTQSRSGIYHRLTQFLTHIHTCEKSQPDLCVFGLQEKTAAPRGKALWCQVKFICAAQYHIKYLGGHHGFTTAPVPDPARSLRRQREAGKKELLKKVEETSGDTFGKTIPLRWQMEETGERERIFQKINKTVSCGSVSSTDRVFLILAPK